MKTTHKQWVTTGFLVLIAPGFASAFSNDRLKNFNPHHADMRSAQDTGLHHARTMAVKSGSENFSYSDLVNNVKKKKKKRPKQQNKPVPIAEASTIALFGIGLLGLVGLTRRRRTYG